MGVVFSCLASCFMFAGELLSSVCLGLGEFGSILCRGLFGVIVGICDVLAACMCCCQVPFSDRPDRDGYTYSTLAFTNPVVNNSRFSNASMAKLSKTTVAIEKRTAAEDSSETDSESGDTTKLAPAAEEIMTSPTQEDKPEAAATTTTFTTTLAYDVKKAKAELKAKLAQEKKEKKLAAIEEKKKRRAKEVRDSPSLSG